jgi:hypothetical protein
MTLRVTAPVDLLLFQPLLTTFPGVPTASESVQDLGSFVLLQQNAAPDSCGSSLHRRRSIQPVVSVRDLGAQVDCDVSVASRGRFVSSSCYAALRQIHSVKSGLQRHALLTLVQTMVVSRIDYCNSTLA